MVSSTPWPHFTPGKDAVPILQEAGRAPGPVWTGGKSRPHRDSIPDRPARSSVAIPTELTAPQRVENCFDYRKIATWIATLFVRDLSAYCSLLSAVLFSVSTLHYFTNIGIIDRINVFKH